MVIHKRYVNHHNNHISAIHKRQRAHTSSSKNGLWY